MENVKFNLVPPQQLSAEAINFLHIAAKEFGGMVSVLQTLENYDPRRDILVEVRNGHDFLAAIHLTVSHQATGKVLTSVLLGGHSFDLWHNNLKTFYYKLAQYHDCDEFMLMGRYGFKRFFPELEEVARVFRVRLKNKPDKQGP